MPQIERTAQKLCACGCGRQPVGGLYLPGHYPRENRRKLVGGVYDRWTIVAELPREQWRGSQREVLAQCECGTRRQVLVNHLLRGHSGSCGCIGRELARQRARPRITRTCEKCGKSFLIRPDKVRKGESRFCSSSCAAQSHWLGHSQELTCGRCGKTFSAKLSQIKDGRGRYCSRSCKKEAARRRVTRTCERCGKPFLLKPSRAKNDRGRFCSKSCAAKGRNRTHGLTNSPTYSSWGAMKSRCLNPKATNFPRYGAKGVSVSERWLVFDNFLADLGERPEGTSLGRFLDEGNYEPGNVAWMTQAEQVEQARLKRERQKAAS